SEKRIGRMSAVVGAVFANNVVSRSVDGPAQELKKTVADTAYDRVSRRSNPSGASFSDEPVTVIRHLIASDASQSRASAAALCVEALIIARDGAAGNVELSHGPRAACEPMDTRA